LVFRNNQHWVGLHRKGPEITRDMQRLQDALAILLDETRPIRNRLDALLPNGRAMVPGMARAIQTAILLVLYPERYGVWNSRSEASMKQLGLWPKLERGESVGSRYSRINEVLLQLSNEIGIDLWTLDGLWWEVADDGGEAGTGEPDDVETRLAVANGQGQKFGLERHLHDFLRDNWESTSLGSDWDLHVEDGEVVGYEYPTAIGRIDLLARHKTRKAWLVVELKRSQTSDDTVGQALRYMGYVREHVAEGSDSVEGLIISHAGDERIRYALSMTSNLGLMLYEVDFRLKQPTKPA
jgi:hypothetical protein